MPFPPVALPARRLLHLRSSNIPPFLVVLSRAFPAHEEQAQGHLRAPDRRLDTPLSTDPGLGGGVRAPRTSPALSFLPVSVRLGPPRVRAACERLNGPGVAHRTRPRFRRSRIIGLAVGLFGRSHAVSRLARQSAGRTRWDLRICNERSHIEHETSQAMEPVACVRVWHLCRATAGFPTTLPRCNRERSCGAGAIHERNPWSSLRLRDHRTGMRRQWSRRGGANEDSQTTHWRGEMSMATSPSSGAALEDGASELKRQLRRGDAPEELLMLAGHVAELARHQNGVTRAALSLLRHGYIAEQVFREYPELRLSIWQPPPAALAIENGEAAAAD